MFDQAGGELEEWLRDRLDDGSDPPTAASPQPLADYGERSWAARVAYLDLLPGEHDRQRHQRPKIRFAPAET